jgi:hypothetical protein
MLVIMFLALVEIVVVGPIVVAFGVSEGIIPIWVALVTYWFVTSGQVWMAWDISKDFPKKETTEEKEEESND